MATTTFARALWQAEINRWIQGPRRDSDHIRIYNLVAAAEDILAPGDPTLEALWHYRDCAVAALEDGGIGWVPMFGGPVVYDPARDVTSAEWNERAGRFRVYLAMAVALNERN